MYMPMWLIIALVAAGVWLLLRRGVPARTLGVNAIEEHVGRQKADLLSPSDIDLDSPRLVDLCEACDVMEMNYTRLRLRVAHEPGKALEIAKDWATYVNALSELKFVREFLDVDTSKDAWDNACERMNAPSIAKDEIETKFRALLGAEWLNIPPDFDERIAAIEDEEERSRAVWGGWERLYWDSRHFRRLRALRGKDDAEHGGVE